MDVIIHKRPTVDKQITSPSKGEGSDKVSQRKPRIDSRTHKHVPVLCLLSSSKPSQPIGHTSLRNLSAASCITSSSQNRITVPPPRHRTPTAYSTVLYSPHELVSQATSGPYSAPTNPCPPPRCSSLSDTRPLPRPPASPRCRPRSSVQRSIPTLPPSSPSSPRLIWSCPGVLPPGHKPRSLPPIPPPRTINTTAEPRPTTLLPPTTADPLPPTLFCLLFALPFHHLCSLPPLHPRDQTPTHILRPTSPL